jgi:hypothetical protein
MDLGGAFANFIAGFQIFSQCTIIVFLNFCAKQQIKLMFYTSLTTELSISNIYKVGIIETFRFSAWTANRG